MLVRTLHLILTYRCLHQCDVCHLHAGPDREGTFMRTELDRVLAEARALDSLLEVVFTGGEPFLYYPLLYDGVRQAREYGFQVAVTTTGDWARDEVAAVTWLAPLRTAGLRELRIASHPGDSSPVRLERGSRAASVARDLGLTVSQDLHVIGPDHAGAPSGARGALSERSYPLRGRGADRHSTGGPVAAGAYASCPLFEDGAELDHVWIEPSGTVQVCQGISIGTLWWRSLRDIVSGFRTDGHAILGPLQRGGPVELASAYGVALEELPAGDGCQICTRVRAILRGRFPDDLGPDAVYGVDRGRH